MVFCQNCWEEKHHGNFRIAHLGLDFYRMVSGLDFKDWCRKCYWKWVLEWARANPPIQIPDTKADRQNLINRRNANGPSQQDQWETAVWVWLAKIKRKHGCMNCSLVVDPAKLLFHHVKPKEFEMARAVSYQPAAIEDELRKCVVLCSPCHGKVHRKKNPISVAHLPLLDGVCPKK